MIEYKLGNIFAEKVDAFVNPVNCAGSACRGFAFTFKLLFPKNFKAYLKACTKKKIKSGKMFVYKTDLESPKYIINFPIKHHWNSIGKVEDIFIGIDDLYKTINKYNIKSIAMPALWQDSQAKDQDLCKTYFHKIFNPLQNDINIFVYG